MAIALGWRVHAWTAVVVAVSGTAASPVVVHRDEVTLMDDEALREPYHAAAAGRRDDAPALIEGVASTATDTAVELIRGFIGSLGDVAAIGVVGGDRKLPDLARILTK